ncbi:unnamed protein product [Anisakis simplex]|uniref:DUF3421 domain-containing protein n=1 Tax=Anisakis simplex TaxID=6269 RepID=A0A0M3KA64_ANISI|nr:unnamed protein product [Anisakis simplex]
MPVREKQSNYVPAKFYQPVHNGDRLPQDAVKPFGRPLSFNGKFYDMAVALWIPDSDKLGVWGRAWEENGQLRAIFVHNDTIKTNEHPELQKGFRILIYPGTPEQNGFRFSWMKVKDADYGTLLYSGRNKHVASVFVESDANNRYEILGNTDWNKRQMDYVEYGTMNLHSVANYGTYNIFDEDVYLLTKQRCNCQC